jgi:hypothetical protein
MKEEKSNDTSKLAIGDVVRVIKNRSKHGFEIGSLVCIWKTCIDGYRAIQGDTIPGKIEHDSWWYVQYDEVETL